MDFTEYLTKNAQYIRAWMYQLLAMLFLCTSLVLYAMPRTTQTSILSVGVFLVFIWCQFTAYTSKIEFETKKGRLHK